MASFVVYCFFEVLVTGYIEHSVEVVLYCVYMKYM